VIRGDRSGGVGSFPEVAETAKRDPGRVCENVRARGRPDAEASATTLDAPEAPDLAISI
jgi:hypothetical protein